MRTTIATAFVASALAVAGAARQPAADSFAKVEASIRAEMEKAGIPGAAVAVIVGDRVVWTRGFGLANVETGAPVTPDTLFQIGSVTKSFTAAAIISAESQGALALDKPVSTYIAGLAPCVGAPTLTQLLSHTGGLIDEPDEFGPQGEEGLGAYQRTWTSEYCMLAPGRSFSYSNSGFSLAGLALQEVDQKPFADVMKARVLAPLGMTRTTFRPTEAMTWPLAVGHRKNEDGKVEVVRPLPNDARLWPAGTLYSTANEMGRFVAALMNDGRVDGSQALPSGLAPRMRAFHAGIPATGESYGLGLYRMVGSRAGHGGAMTGYSAQFEMGRPGVVVLTNADGINPGSLVSAVGAAALESPLVQARYAELEREALRAGPPPPPVVEGLRAPKTALVLTSAQAERYVGRYANPRRFTVEVVRDGTSLTLRRFGRDVLLRAMTDGTFLVDGPSGRSETIAFCLGPDGRADYLQMNVWALARVP